METNTKWKIQKGFEKLEPFLVGEPKQFYLDKGDYYCLRASTEDETNQCYACPYTDSGSNDCTFEEANLYTNPVPNVRRGVGFEEERFLILRPTFNIDEQTLDDIPSDILSTDQKNSLYPYNLHFILDFLDKENFLSGLVVYKGQVRYYGPKEAFDISKYAKYFTYIDEYVPTHTLTALDFSAIEPRLNTIVSREPKWIEVFAGEDKPIFKKIKLKVTYESLTTHQKKDLLLEGEEIFCFLKGELDKETYKDQCTKCSLDNDCATLQNFFKKVPGDWHSKNAEAFFGDTFIKETDKKKKKGMRGDIKIVGLAITYGGTSYTVSNTLNWTKEKSQKHIDDFFRDLLVLDTYVNTAKRTVLETGKVFNLFGRYKDVSNIAFSKKFGDRLEAQRQALNHPIQSGAADLLKIAMIRKDDLILKNKWNPLAGQQIPQSVGSLTYRDFIVMFLSTVHDELVNGIQDLKLNEIIPQIYKAMQIQDVMNALQAGFTLELDCEYDETRSWTALKMFHNGKTYLLRQLSNLDEDQVNVTSYVQSVGDSIIIDFKELGKEKLQVMQKMAEFITANQEKLSEFKTYTIFITQEGQRFKHDVKFPISFIDNLQIPYTLS